jgi:hypothetical protein
VLVEPNAAHGNKAITYGKVYNPSEAVLVVCWGDEEPGLIQEIKDAVLALLRARLKDAQLAWELA